MSTHESAASNWPRARDSFSEYAFCSFPVFDVPADVQETLDPWFRQFIGKSSHDVRALLRGQWESLQLNELRAVASRLLKFPPVGILHSKTPNWCDTAWLMLGHVSLCNEDMHRYAAAAAEQPPDLGWTLGLPVDYYLPAPATLPPELRAKISPDNLLTNFFLTFGGLRLDAPFGGMQFHKFPMALTDVSLGDADPIIGTGWEAAQELFMNSTGDTLLIGAEGKIAWLPHDDRSDIRPIATSFSELLNEFAAAGYWKEAYD